MNSFFTFIFFFLFKMAFELYGILAGNVSPITGDKIAPAYGPDKDAKDDKDDEKDKESFLNKVVTPIYNVVAKVLFSLTYFCTNILCFNFFGLCIT